MEKFKTLLIILLLAYFINDLPIWVEKIGFWLMAALFFSFYYLTKEWLKESEE